MKYSISRESIETLRQMRVLQKRFFAGDKTVVGRAKALEREVDAILAGFPTNDGLFAQDEDYIAPIPSDPRNV